MGAPETTAAAVLSPGSLPSITRIGTGEKLLPIVSAFRGRNSSKAPPLRCSVVRSNIPVRVVSWLCLRRSLFSDHARLAHFRRGWYAGVGRRGRLIAMPSCQCGRASREGWPSRQTQRTASSFLYGCHRVEDLCGCERQSLNVAQVVMDATLRHLSSGKRGLASETTSTRSKRLSVCSSITTPLPNHDRNHGVLDCTSEGESCLKVRVCGYTDPLAGGLAQRKSWQNLPLPNHRAAKYTSQPLSSLPRKIGIVYDAVKWENAG